MINYKIMNDFIKPYKEEYTVKFNIAIPLFDNIINDIDININKSLDKGSNFKYFKILQLNKQYENLSQRNKDLVNKVIKINEITEIFQYLDENKIKILKTYIINKQLDKCNKEINKIIHNYVFSNTIIKNKLIKCYEILNNKYIKEIYENDIKIYETIFIDINIPKIYDLLKKYKIIDWKLNELLILDETYIYEIIKKRINIINKSEDINQFQYNLKQLLLNTFKEHIIRDSILINNPLESFDISECIKYNKNNYLTIETLCNLIFINDFLMLNNDIYNDIEIYFYGFIKNHILYNLSIDCDNYIQPPNKYIIGISNNKIINVNILNKELDDSLKIYDIFIKIFQALEFLQKKYGFIHNNLIISNIIVNNDKINIINFDASCFIIKNEIYITYDNNLLNNDFKKIDIKNLLKDYNNSIFNELLDSSNNLNSQNLCDILLCKARYEVIINLIKKKFNFKDDDISIIIACINYRASNSYKSRIINYSRYDYESNVSQYLPLIIYISKFYKFDKEKFIESNNKINGLTVDYYTMNPIQYIDYNLIENHIIKYKDEYFEKFNKKLPKFDNISDKIFFLNPNKRKFKYFKILEETLYKNNNIIKEIFNLNNKIINDNILKNSEGVLKFKLNSLHRGLIMLKIFTDYIYNKSNKNLKQNINKISKYYEYYNNLSNIHKFSLITKEVSTNIYEKLRKDIYSESENILLNYTKNLIELHDKNEILKINKLIKNIINIYNRDNLSLLEKLLINHYKFVNDAMLLNKIEKLILKRKHSLLNNEIYNIFLEECQIYKEFIEYINSNKSETIVDFLEKNIKIKRFLLKYNILDNQSNNYYKFLIYDIKYNCNSDMNNRKQYIKEIIKKRIDIIRSSKTFNIFQYNLKKELIVNVIKKLHIYNTILIKHPLEGYSINKSIKTNQEKYYYTIILSNIIYIIDYLELNDNNPLIGEPLGIGGAKGTIFNVVGEPGQLMKRSNKNKLEACLREFIIHSILYELSNEYIIKPYSYTIGNKHAYFIIEKIYKLDTKQLNIKKGDTLMNMINNINFAKLNEKKKSRIIINILIKIFKLLNELQNKYGFIHCDLITQNIMVNYSSTYKINDIYIIDFEQTMLLFDDIYIIGVNNNKYDYDILLKDFGKNEYWKTIDTFFLIFVLFYRFYRKIDGHNKKQNIVNLPNINNKLSEKNKYINKLLPQKIQKFVSENILGLYNVNIYNNSHKYLNELYTFNYVHKYFHYYFFKETMFASFFNKIRQNNLNNKIKCKLSHKELITNLLPTNLINNLQNINLKFI